MPLLATVIYLAEIASDPVQPFQNEGIGDKLLY